MPHLILVPGVLESSTVSYSSPLAHSGVWSGQEWALDLEGTPGGAAAGRRAGWGWQVLGGQEF